jgi:hypothetical protein
VTLAAAFERLERDAREKKELLRPVDVADFLLTAIDFYIRAGHRRGKARTTLRTEYYGLMYFYEDIVLQNGFVSEAGVQPVSLSSISPDDILLHLHRLRTKTPEISRSRRKLATLR